VAEALRELPGSGIVYVLTVAEAERVAGFLSEQGADVASYTGQTENRTDLEDRLRDNKIKALVATSALGMGYDKPDLAFCIHLGSPASPVAYYQQVGRAGRALDDAMAVLVPSKSDERIWDYFATAGIPDPEQVDRVLELIVDEPSSESAISTATGIRPGRLSTLLKIIAVDDAVQKVPGGWVSTGKGWTYDQRKWTELKRVRSAEADLMRRYAHGEGCLMRFLQLALDDPDPAPCGRCSVCTGELPAPGARPTPETIQAAQRFFRGLDVLVEPRKLWPSRLEGVKGKINFLAEGRAIAYADDPAWQETIDRISDRDGEAPQEILDAAVEAMKRWSRSWQRPTAVVPMPSRRRQSLINSVAGHLAGVGRLPLVEALEITGPRPTEDAASGVRVRELLTGLGLRSGTQLSGPVLLVDDTIRSRWTMTVAGKLLTDAGADSVLPFAVHQLP
jgi:ATP-dependent DNA helicase RecQ